MKQVRDPYHVLKVSPDASQAAIKEAYRRLAKLYHPDLNKSDPVVASKFRKIQAAYEILRDEGKRKLYDRDGMTSSFIDRNDDSSGLWSMMRGQRTPKNSSTNLDIWHSVVVPFSLAALGGQKMLSLPHGRKLLVTIPPGSRDGMRLRIKHKGLTRNGSSGDLFVVLQIPEDSRYRVIGDDIHIDATISLKEAILGGKVTLSTLHGKVSVTLIPGTNAGTLLRLKAKGMPADDSGVAGDCFAHLSIRLPEPIPEEMKALVSKLPSKTWL